MSARDHRKMALQIAGVRASETHLPENDRVFYDPYAEYFKNASCDRNVSPMFNFVHATVSSKE